MARFDGKYLKATSSSRSGRRNQEQCRTSHKFHWVVWSGPYGSAARARKTALMDQDGGREPTIGLELPIPFSSCWTISREPTVDPSGKPGWTTGMAVLEINYKRNQHQKIIYPCHSCLFLILSSKQTYTKHSNHGKKKAPNEQHFYLIPPSPHIPPPSC